MNKIKTLKATAFIFLIGFSLSTNGIAQTLKFINGSWFNGTSFVLKKEFYSVDGVFSSMTPVKIDSVIDLNGKFIIPPFGEAHNHNVRKYSTFKLLNDKYLEAGIFYVKNPNCLSGTKAELIESKLINEKNSIDAVFANGGFTGIDGHPIGVVKIQMMQGYWTAEEGDGNFYNAISSESDLEKKWPIFLSSKPDFVKVYLLFSEEFDKREHNSSYIGFKGLNPKLVEEVVRKAHAAGLRVSAHIETAADFRNAILAGVDEISHSPGFRGDPMLNQRASLSDYDRFLITDEDATLAAQKGVSVVTTMSDVEQLPFFVSMKSRVKSVHEKNLKKLKKAGVTIALGSDSYDNNSISELDYLLKKDMFSNLELLKMLCETTPATIFPTRKIGQLADGYEASFLVLEKDPLRNINAINEKTLLIKQGFVLSNLGKSN